MGIFHFITLRKHGGHCTSAYANTHREVSCLIRGCFGLPQAPMKVSRAQSSICVRPGGEGVRPREAGSHGFLMSHVLTGLLVSCYRCALSGLMRCRKFGRPKRLFRLSGYVSRIKTACALPGIAERRACLLSLTKTLPFGVKALMHMDCHTGKKSRDESLARNESTSKTGS